MTRNSARVCEHIRSGSTATIAFSRLNAEYLNCHRYQQPAYLTPNRPYLCSCEIECGQNSLVISFFNRRSNGTAVYSVCYELHEKKKTEIDSDKQRTYLGINCSGWADDKFDIFTIQPQLTPFSHRGNTYSSHAVQHDIRRSHISNYIFSWWCGKHFWFLQYALNLCMQKKLPFASFWLESRNIFQSVVIEIPRNSKSNFIVHYIPSHGFHKIATTI